MVEWATTRSSLHPGTPCPACGSPSHSTFYEIKGVPAHSVLLMPSRDVALSYPRGNIILAYCRICGFIFNQAFDPALLQYSSAYEETQGFSPTFARFHRRLAEYLIHRYELRNKSILEIGCGKGEFLSLLCELGGNFGYGFDPAYVTDRNPSKAKDRTTFISDFYSEKYCAYVGDFVCCKMTLEHISYPADFVQMVRRSIGTRTDTIVFFQVPDVRRILRDMAFWDIYYEHCSYFTQGSLARLFRRCDFDIIDLRTEYDGQYLMIEARPGPKSSSSRLPNEEDMEECGSEVTHFSHDCQQRIVEWKDRFREITRTGKRAVIWGSGSKGVAFLTTLGIQGEVDYVIDINPYRQGMFMPGSGHRIVGPPYLREYPPDIVIVMNPIYLEEIRTELNRMGLAPMLIAV